MANRAGGARPQNIGHTIRVFVSYLGHAKKRLMLVALLVSISGLAALLGTYMIKPVVAAVGRGDVPVLVTHKLWFALLRGLFLTLDETFLSTLNRYR